VGWRFCSLKTFRTLQREDFDCGDEEINNYLKNLVETADEAGFSRTFLMIIEPGEAKVCGFYIFRNLGGANLMERTYKISGINATFSYPIWETAEIEVTCLELAEQWRRETSMMSLVTKMSIAALIQAYQSDLFEPVV
jgi:hypothetical protein